MSDGTTTWTYTYDANGMRTSRSNGTDTYTYVYNGSQLVQMTKGSDTLYFTYGVTGPTSVTWNGTTYYYVLNGQGDVISILDGDGNCVVLYYYADAWGSYPTPEGTMASTLGTLNPLRYRSYVYDQETELYYLQSRYYNPEWGRFINADGYTTTGQGLLGNNMFAYCGNNPVIRVDDSGELWGLIAVAGVISATISGISNAISTARSGGTARDSVAAGLIGFGAGAVGFVSAALTGFSPWGNILGRAVATTICDLGTSYARNGEITGQDIVNTSIDVVMDSCFSCVTYYYTDPIQDMIKQSTINATIDGVVDIVESELFTTPASGTSREPSAGTSREQTRRRITCRAVLRKVDLYY